jgi:hypothetical protein
MNDPIMQFAANMIRNNPNIANNPRNKDLVNVILNGDSARGEQIATNLCNTYGVSKEDGIQQAKQFFNIPF